MIGTDNILKCIMITNRAIYTLLTILILFASACSNDARLNHVRDQLPGAWVTQDGVAPHGDPAYQVYEFTADGKVPRRELIVVVNGDANLAQRLDWTYGKPESYSIAMKRRAFDDASGTNASIDHLLPAITIHRSDDDDIVFYVVSISQSNVVCRYNDGHQFELLRVATNTSAIRKAL